MGKIKLLVCVAAIVVALCLVLASCGGDDTTTTTPDSTVASGTTAATTTAASTTENTTESTVTTTAPVVTDDDPGDDNMSNSEKLMEGRFWIELHTPVSVSKRTGTDGKEYEYCFFFGIKAEGGHLFNDPDTGLPGLNFTTPECVTINDEIYEVEYYETKDWWQIWFVAKDFVPVDGEEYDIVLFINIDSEVHGDNLGGYYVWPLELFVYEEPDEIVSQYGDIHQMIPDIDERTQLLYHDEFSVTDGQIKFTFKSDGDPFNNNAGQPGVSYTRFGKLFINGEEIEIVADSYITEQHYIIYFTVDYTFEPGEEYEFLFTIEPNDDTGTFCNDSDGYFVLQNYTAVEPVDPEV